MDPISVISFTIGAASVASIFQTCLHGYRALNTAMAIGDTALTLNLQFRVEEVRLVLWGRNWGLVKVQEKRLAKCGGKGSFDSDSEDGDDEAGTTGDDVVALDLVDEELEIPGLRDLTIEVLGRINSALQEWRSVGERYGAAPATNQEGSGWSNAGNSKVSSNKLLSKISSKQAKETKDISKKNTITSKIRWALKDKADLEELLAKLANLNDSLEKLLPRRERTSLARGLAGEMLNILENGSISDSDSEINEQLSLLKGSDEMKAARIVRLKRSNKTEVAEKKPEDAEEESSETCPDGPTPFSKPSVWAEGNPGSMEIPFQDFVRLVEPKLEQYQVVRGSSRRTDVTYAPVPRSVAIYAPTSSKASSGGPVLGTEGSAQVTLVEWRLSAHESSASELTEQDLKDRRDHIARLLHRTSVTDADFRILDCLGYTTTDGHTSDGSTHSLVGYVYRYPEFASPKSLPVSLRELVGEAYHSDNPTVPSLDARFKLARDLAIALYQLQCAGWVHRKISSYNVIFFRDKITQELNLGQPFLVGWQYCRPDDQRRLFPSEQSTESIGDLDMYVHRRRLILGGHGRFPRFRKSFDIYSLGVILIEIAFWEPIYALTTEEERAYMDEKKEVSSGYQANDWWKAILKTAEQELAQEMGVAYQQVVLFCLKGLENNQSDEDEQEREEDREERDSRNRYYIDAGFEEVGIEKEFFWRVLKPLEKFRF